MIITLTTHNFRRTPEGTCEQLPGSASHVFHAAGWRYEAPKLRIFNTGGGESVIATPFREFRVDGEPTQIEGKEVQP